MMVYSYKDKANYYRVNKIPSDVPNKPSQANRIDTNDETMDESAFTQGHSSMDETIHKNKIQTTLKETKEVIQTTTQVDNRHYQMTQIHETEVRHTNSGNQVSPRNQTHRRMGPDPNARFSNRKSNREYEEDLGESRSDLQSLQDQHFQQTYDNDVEVEDDMHEQVEQEKQGGFPMGGFNFQKKQANLVHNQFPEQPNGGYNMQKNGKDPRANQEYEDEPFYLNEEPTEEAVKSSPMAPSNPNALTPLEAYENYPRDRVRLSRKRLNERTTEILKMRASDGENVLLLFLWRIEIERLRRESEKMREKNNNLEGRLKRMEEKFRDMRLDYEEKCDEVVHLQEMLDRRQEAGPGGMEEITILREKVEELERLKIELVQEVELKDRDVEELDEEVREKEGEIEDLRKMVRKLKEDPKESPENAKRIDELEEENDDLANQVEDLKRKNRELMKEGKGEEGKEREEELENALKKLRREKKDLENENDELAEEVAKLKKKQRESENNLKGNEEVEKENEKLREGMKRLKREKRELGDEVEDLQHEVERLKKRGKRGGNEDLELRNQELENEVKKLKEGKEKLGDERELVMKANERIVQLVEQNNHLQNQLVILEEELEEEREKEKESEGAMEMMNFYKKRAENLEVRSSLPQKKEEEKGEEPKGVDEEMELELANLKMELEKKKEDVRRMEEEGKKKDEELEKMKAKVEKAQMAADKLREAKRGLDRQVRELTKNPDERETLMKKNERLKEQMRAMEERLDKKEQERDMLESSIIKTNEEVLRLKRLLAEKDDQLEDLQKGIEHSQPIRVGKPDKEQVNASLVENMENEIRELTSDNQQLGDKVEELFKELEVEVARSDQLRIQVMLLATELERKSNEVIVISRTIEQKETELIEIMKERNSVKHNVNRQMEKMLQENKQFGLEKEMEVNKLKMEKNKLLNYVDIYKKNTEEMERKITKLIQKHETLKEKYTAQQNLISSLQASDIGRQDHRGENKVLLGKIKELEMKNRVLEIENQKLDELLFEKMKEMELNTEN